MIMEGQVDRGAYFSPCRAYRYKLWRTWDSTKPKVMFLMLNPSTADEVHNDPTVERCERRARLMGFGGLVVCNIFAYRATDPQEMKSVIDPVGPENNQVIAALANDVAQIVCAWGNHGQHLKRSTYMRKLLKKHRRKLKVLKLAKTGEPVHPLYQPYALLPSDWLIEDEI